MIRILCLLFIGLSAFAQESAKPYPQQLNYGDGILYPNYLSRSELNQEVKTFLLNWKKRYIHKGCTPGSYYVFSNLEGHGTSGEAGGVITVSEAHGYGMMLMAYMAGIDPEAKTVFDGMVKFYKEHPAESHPELMAWQQVEGCINNPEYGGSSAFDGDADIAFAFLLADAQWGSSGAIDYLSEGKRMISAIWQYEIDQRKYYTNLGDWAKESMKHAFGTRPSDFMVTHFKAFAKHQPEWHKAVQFCQNTYLEIHQTTSQKTALLPDFVEVTYKNVTPAPAQFLEGEFDGAYNYNACRFPWRLGLDRLMTQDTTLKNALSTFSHWAEKTSAGVPSQFGSGYTLNGVMLPERNYASPAFIAPLAVTAMQSNQQTWLNALTKHCLEEPLEAQAYYENTIKAICLLIASGNYWQP